MMNKSKILIALAMSMSMVAANALADDPTPSPSTTVAGGTVHFTGSLVDAACSVSTESANQTVDLGQHPLHDFKKAGDVSELHPFTIKLEDCDTTVASSASVAFSGAVDGTNTAVLAIDSSGSNGAGATGVGIQILDEVSKVIVPDGASFSTAHKLIDGENVLNFKAQYVATSLKPTAGKANADATFIMQYE